LQTAGGLSKRSFSPLEGETMLEYMHWVMIVPLVCGCDAPDEIRQGAPATQRAEADLIDADKAHEMVWQLPEVQRWVRWIRRKTDNRVRGCTMLGNDAPVERDGKRFWSIGFYEDQPTHMHRWENFMVDTRSGEIFVEDIVDCSLKTLERWREKDKPMERAPNAPPKQSVAPAKAVSNSPVNESRLSDNSTAHKAINNHES